VVKPVVYRAGFTLLEVLLTLAILTAIAAVMLPQLGGLLDGRRLDRAADLMRIEMTRARIAAMRGGQTMMLEVQPETGQFRVRPYSSLSDATETDQAMPGTSALLTGADQATFVPVPQDAAAETKDLELPETIVFGAVAVAATARSAEIAQNAAGTAATIEGAGGPYSTPILFYSDGTCSTAAVEVKHAEMGTLVVKLRGITGEVTVQDGVTSGEGG